MLDVSRHMYERLYDMKRRYTELIVWNISHLIMCLIAFCD